MITSDIQRKRVAMQLLERACMDAAMEK